MYKKKSSPENEGGGATGQNDDDTTSCQTPPSSTPSAHKRSRESMSIQPRKLNLSNDDEETPSDASDVTLPSLTTNNDLTCSDSMGTPNAKKRRLTISTPQSLPHASSGVSDGTIAELNTKISAARLEYEQKEQEFQRQFQLMSQMRNVSRELREHEQTIAQLQQFQEEQQQESQQSETNTFPDQYTKLLSAYLQDDTESDIETLTDKIWDQWTTLTVNKDSSEDDEEGGGAVVRRRRRVKREDRGEATNQETEQEQKPSSPEESEPASSMNDVASHQDEQPSSAPVNCVASVVHEDKTTTNKLTLTFSRQVLKVKIEAISTLENYGVVDAPQYSLFVREVVHVTHLPKELRDPLKERRKESKNIRKVLRNMHRDVVKLKKEVQKLEAKLETQVQKQLALMVKQEEKLKKMEEKEQQLLLQQQQQQLQQQQKQQQQQVAEKKKSTSMNISKFATKMKINEQTTTVGITNRPLNVMSESEIDSILQSADSEAVAVSVQGFLSDVKQRNLLSNNWKNKDKREKRVRLYYHCRHISPTEKAVYVKPLATVGSVNEGASVFNYKPRFIARKCWNPFQVEEDYDEPCYESADEEENDEDIEGEDILEDDEEDDEDEDEPLPGLEDYDEDEDDDFVVHDGYVSGNDDEEDDDDLMEGTESTTDKINKKKQFNREENIALKRKSLGNRKRGRGGIELVTLDTRHFFYNDHQMKPLEAVQPIDTTEPMDFSDLSWMFSTASVSIGMMDSLRKPDMKKKETNHFVFAEHKIPDECLFEQEEQRTHWKQYICNSSLQQLVLFANGYEGGKQKLVDDFMTSFQQPKSKRHKVTKVLARKQLDEIVYKSDKQIIAGETGPRALFKVYQCIIDKVSTLSGDSEDSVSESNEETSEPLTPRRRRVIRKRISIVPSTSSDDEESDSDSAPATPKQTPSKKNRNVLASAVKPEPKKLITYTPNRKRKENPNKDHDEDTSANSSKKVKSNPVSTVSIANYFTKSS